MFKIIRQISNPNGEKPLDINILYDKDYIISQLKELKDIALASERVRIDEDPCNGYMSKEEISSEYEKAMKIVKDLSEDLLYKRAIRLPKSEDGLFMSGGRVTIKKVDCAKYYDSYEPAWQFQDVELVPYAPNTVMLCLVDKRW